MCKLKEIHKVKNISPESRKTYSRILWGYDKNFSTFIREGVKVLNTKNSYAMHKGITQCFLVCLLLLNSGCLSLLSPGTPNDQATITENETLRYNFEFVRLLNTPANWLTYPPTWLTYLQILTLTHSIIHSPVHSLIRSLTFLLVYLY